MSKIFETSNSKKMELIAKTFFDNQFEKKSEQSNKDEVIKINDHTPKNSLTEAYSNIQYNDLLLKDILGGYSAGHPAANLSREGTLKEKLRTLETDDLHLRGLVFDLFTDFYIHFEHNLFVLQKEKVPPTHSLKQKLNTMLHRSFPLQR